jgi:hypothetical protein
MFKNTSNCLMAVVLMVALLMLSGIASASDEDSKTTPVQKLVIGAYEPGLRAYEPHLLAFDPKLTAYERGLSAYLPGFRDRDPQFTESHPRLRPYSPRLSAADSAEFRWNEPLASIDKNPRLSRRLSFGPEGGDLGSPMWKPLNQEIRIRPAAGR